jgi:hypothetical protein
MKKAIDKMRMISIGDENCIFSDLYDYYLESIYKSACVYSKFKGTEKQSYKERENP